MKRSFSALLVAATLALTGTLTGCATFTDADVAARVGDDEISNDRLASIAREQLGVDDADRVDMQTVIGILNNWVLDRILRADLAAAGAPLDEVEGPLTNATLDESINSSFGVWQQTPATPIPQDRLRARYQLGPTESNLICTAHILLGDEAAANEVLERLADGEEFADLASELSTDASGAGGGVLPCATTTDFRAQYIPEYVEAALDAEMGEPVGPVMSQFGYHVILVRPFDDLGGDELIGLVASPQVRFDFASEEFDVYVDPRYGSFNASAGITPLG